MRRILFIWILSWQIFAQAQDTLLFSQYLELVRQYHPDSKNADFVRDKAKQNVTEARGAFDPQLYLKYKNKDFKSNKDLKSKEYYSLFNAGVEIPTITGITIKGGYEDNQGVYLNPENNVTDYGVSYIGVSVPLGKGMFTDENRQALRQAKIGQRRSEQLAQIQLNDLLLEAAVAYWEWYFAFGEMRAIEETYALAEKRYKNEVLQFTYGEKAQLDTLKAYVQKQDRLIAFREAFVEWKSKSYTLNNYLWDSTWVLQENLIPESRIGDYVQNVSINEAYIDSLTRTSPYVLDYQLKLEGLKAERRLKIEKVKPKINLEYNYLFQGTDISMPSNFSTNYKWGVSASFPLFIRAERAGLKLNTIKIQETQYMLNEKERELENKLKTAMFELQYLLQQYEVVLQNVEAYRKLVLAEQTKFNLGESDLFMLNEWETKFQNILIKKAKMEFKVMKAQAKLEYLSNDF